MWIPDSSNTYGGACISTNSKVRKRDNLENFGAFMSITIDHFVNLIVRHRFTLDRADSTPTRNAKRASTHTPDQNFETLKQLRQNNDPEGVGSQLDRLFPLSRRIRDMPFAGTGRGPQTARHSMGRRSRTDRNSQFTCPTRHCCHREWTDS